MHHDQMVHLMVRALEMGATRRSAMSAEWDIAGRCQQPVTRELYVAPEAGPGRENSFLSAVQKLWPGAKPVGHAADFKSRRVNRRSIVVSPQSKLPLRLVMSLRCRKCDPCRRMRQMLWTTRAVSECSMASRTWFGTLTLRPEAHATMVSRARVELSDQGVDFDTLPFGEQFLQRHRQVSIELTKYLKRVRKESRAMFRYLLVAEHHKSGLPHYHALLHEWHGMGCVKHATLSKQWSLGFEKWRLLSDAREARYVCKYLGKATVARVRASGDYGNGFALSAIAKSIAPVREREKVTPQKGTLLGLSQRRDDDGISGSVSSGGGALRSDRPKDGQEL